ncbi:MAG TPA: site-specific DNA-methyltransferase [Polyangiaceae bacterium]|nr:site-specific DNA-methyltransferase [Polyangiaceae bacterium]
MNTLYRGDNLEVLRRHLPAGSVDLVYLDPPFQSGRDYHVAFEARSRGAAVARASREAFKDTWRWDAGAERSFVELERAARDGAGKPAAERAARALGALRAIVGESDVMAYLCMMAPRLVELRRVMKESGSLYLHCDPTASHYLKVLLDAVFGPACFRNEVVWRYRRWPARARRFQRMHDVLLFYTASAGGEHTFNTLYGYEKLAESTLKTFGTRKQRADFSSGHRKPAVEAVDTQGPPLSDYWDVADAGEVARADRAGTDGAGFEREGVPLGDAWEVGVIAAIGKERTGYPTQKPEALLERVVRASSREGDVVLDPFCGSGTAIAVAERLKRRWIGIDVAPLAIELARDRMRGALFELRSGAMGGIKKVRCARPAAPDAARRGRSVKPARRAVSPG